MRRNEAGGRARKKSQALKQVIQGRSYSPIKDLGLDSKSKGIPLKAFTLKKNMIRLTFKKQITSDTGKEQTGRRQEWM